MGVPAELAYATDLRVIECARDVHVRDDLEANRRSIGDTAWATALHAMADEAWTAGWEAAHPAVDALAVLPLKTATDRAVRAALSRAGADDDARETSLDAAETRRQGAAHPRRPRFRVVGVGGAPLGRRLRGGRRRRRGAGSGRRCRR